MTEESCEKAPWITASPLRRAAFRGVFFSFAFTALSATFVVAFRHRIEVRPETFVAFGVIAFVSFLLVAGLAVVELLAERRARSIPRDLVAALVAGVVWWLGIVLGIFQWGYLSALVTTGDVAQALTSMSSASSELRNPRLLGLVWGFAAPAVPLVFVRLRGMSLWFQLLVVPFVGVGLGLPATLKAKETVYLFVVAGAFFLPLACALADRLEQKWTRDRT